MTFFNRMALSSALTGNAGPFPSPFPTSSRFDSIFGAVLDPRRDIDAECGYPDITSHISVELYRQLFDREPIATRVCEVLCKEAWQALPTVVEDEDADNLTEFEKAWDELNQTLMPNQSWFQDAEGSPIWEALIRADILSGIGHFGLILMGLDDGRNLQEPVDGVLAVNNGVPIHDSFVTEQEYNQILNQEKLKRKVLEWDAQANRGQGKMVENERLVNKPWTEREKAEIRNWRERGKLVENQIKLAVENRSRFPFDQRSEDDRESPVLGGGYSLTQNVLTDPFPYGRTPNEPTPFDASNKGPGMPKGNSPNDPPALSTNPASSSGYGPGPYPPEAAGTDRQFQGEGWGIGMPPPFAVVDGKAQVGGKSAAQSAAPSGYSLAGSDQQYFGVQFGPSEQPADKPSKKKRKLLFLRVYDESLVQVVRYEWNIRNPRFGFPVMYRITLNDPREVHSGIGLPIATVFVHWSRVIHLADNRMSSEIFGVPRMRPVLNRLLDLRKIYGSDAEAFWKNVVMKMSLETHPQLGGDVDIDEQGLADMMENYQNSLQNYLVTRGLSVKTMSPAVASVKDHVEVQIEAICIKIGCPVRVFKGSERGELASSQDDASWNDRLRFRQQSYITPRVIAPFIDRLIQIGVLPEPDGYSVKWPDLDSLTDKDKAQIALQLTQALAAYVQGGIEQLMPPKEYFVRILEWDEDTADEIIDETEKKQQQDEDDAEDKDGIQAVPPLGFKDAPKPPTIVAPGGAPGMGAKPGMPGMGAKPGMGGPGGAGMGGSFGGAGMGGGGAKGGGGGAGGSAGGGGLSAPGLS